MSTQTKDAVDAATLREDPALQFNMTFPTISRDLPVKLTERGAPQPPSAVALLSHEAYLEFSAALVRNDPSGMAAKLKAVRHALDADPDVDFDATRPIVDTSSLGEARPPGEIDVAAAKATLARNADRTKTPSVAHCYSALNATQHAHYRRILDEYFGSNGSKPPPPASDEFPQIADAIDIIAQERSQFLSRVRDDVVKCPLREYLKAHNSPEHLRGLPAGVNLEHYVLNHNFIADEVANFATGLLENKRVRMRKFLDETNTASVAATSSFSAVANVTDLSAVVSTAGGSATIEAKGAIVPLSSSQSIGAVDPGVAEGVLADCSPRHMLDMRSLRAGGGVGNHCGSLFSSVCDPAVLAAVEARHKGGLPAVVLSVGALVSLATQPLAAFRAATALPIRIERRENGSRVIAVGRPFGVSDAPATRKECARLALKRVIDADEGLPSTRFLGAPQRAAFALRLPQCGAECFLAAKVRTGADGTPHIIHVKVEHCSKGYNAVADDPADFRYEEFAPAELLRLALLFHCIPHLHVVVYRVDAYTSSVIGIDTLTKHTFLGLLTATGQAHELRFPLYETLGTSLIGLTECVSAAPKATGPLVLFREANGTRLTLGTSALLASRPAKKQQQQRVALDGDDDEEGEVDFDPMRRDGAETGFAALLLRDPQAGEIEAAHDRVAYREYLRPATWRNRRRVAFTFPPKEEVDALRGAAAGAFDAEKPASGGGGGGRRGGQRFNGSPAALQAAAASEPYVAPSLVFKVRVSRSTTTGSMSFVAGRK